MSNFNIKAIQARQILDSRGRPTVEVDIALADGTVGRASVPSGASTGTSEAHELRDGDAARYEGLSVLKAVANVEGEIATALKGHSVENQSALDQVLLELDGTEQLTRLGANAILGVSLAASRAAAQSSGRPLYHYIAELADVQRVVMPMPMVNILSGGLHAGRGMDVQDFLAVPRSAGSITEAIEMIARLRSSASKVSAKRGLPVLLADEGGLSPGLATGREALQLMIESIEHAGFKPGEDIVITIDVAATSLFNKETGLYELKREGKNITGEQMSEMVAGWVSEFPIVSVEDALDEEDWAGWAALTAKIGNKVRLIGDDFFTTNAKRLERGVKQGCANGVLVKVNQNGTLSGTLEVIAMAKAAQYAPVVSARSGETEDSFIADLAVGSAAGQIKIGSVRCSDRLSKYNQLMRIEQQSGAGFAGMSSFLGFE